MLALPASIAQLGYVPGFIMLFVGAANLGIGLYCFRYLSFKYPTARIYSQLVKQIMGDKCEKLINWVYLIYVWTSLIAYILVTQKFL